ncbi:EmrB/QacA subfamily drug resistance transporter [Kitasatospora sp. MAP12-15]|uniref:MFS transporter n=1 Tax=unclassified Kitasatospora TaxID=2633591 RepID=UPI002475AD0D|nr:MFS transporter [Kitasatospora sp. MAP12-44]MDH6115295.1 EmrB/QacA subfamily drug resistance transporter [Kitasatospora sp. MAP12-44]
MARTDTRPHYNVTFAVLLLGVAAYSLLQSLIIPVLPTLMQHLHTTQDTATWLMTGYLLSASVATPILGRIGDKAGKERMLIVTLVALTAGSALAGMANSIGLMIVARVIQGLGGGVLPLAFGIIRDEFPAVRVRSAVGITAALTAVGGGLGLLLAGPIVDNMDYHWLFWFPMIMTAVATVATYWFVPESPVRTPGRISWGAALLLSVWLVALLLAVSEGPSWGWGSGRILGLFAAAVVFAALWIIVELRSDAPLIDMRMMRIPAVWTANLVALLFGVVMYTAMTFLPQLVQTPAKLAGYGFSASITQSGVYMLPMTIGMFVLGVLTGPLAARFGSKRVLVAGGLVTIAPFALLALAHDKGWEIYLASSLMGIGMGLAFSSMSSIVVEAVSPVQTGVASGMNANIRTIGGAVGSSVAASILTSGVTAAHPFPQDSGYSSTFWFLAGAAVLAAVAALLIPTLRRSTAGAAQAQQAVPSQVPETEGSTVV